MFVIGNELLKLVLIDSLILLIAIIISSIYISKKSIGKEKIALYIYDCNILYLQYICKTCTRLFITYTSYLYFLSKDSCRIINLRFFLYWALWDAFNSLFYS